MPNHIETINKFRESLDRNAPDIDTQAAGMVLQLEDMVNNGTDEVRQDLARLRRDIEPLLTQSVTSTAHQNLRALRDQMDRRMILAYHPETGIAGVSNVVRAGINRLFVAESDYLPQVATMSPATQALVRGGLVAAGIAAAGVAVVAGFTLIRTFWRGLKYAATNPLGAMAAVTGAIVTGGALGAALRALPLPDSWRAWMPTWLNGTAGQINVKQLEQSFQTQRTTTETNMTAFRTEFGNFLSATPPPPDQIITAVTTVRGSIRTEQALLSTANIERIPQAGRQALRNRVTELQTYATEVDGAVAQMSRSGMQFPDLPPQNPGSPQVEPAGAEKIARQAEESIRTAVPAGQPILFSDTRLRGANVEESPNLLNLERTFTIGNMTVGIERNAPYALRIGNTRFTVQHNRFAINLLRIATAGRAVQFGSRNFLRFDGDLNREEGPIISTISLTGIPLTGSAYIEDTDLQTILQAVQNTTTNSTVSVTMNRHTDTPQTTGGLIGIGTTPVPPDVDVPNGNGRTRLWRVQENIRVTRLPA